MESGIIKDDQIHASHWLYRNAHYKASYARLNLTSASGSWCSADIQQKKNQYIQIDLLKNTKLTAIATQGRHNSVEFIEAFQIKYQRDNENFFRNYEETQGTWKVCKQHSHVHYLFELVGILQVWSMFHTTQKYHQLEGLYCSCTVFYRGGQIYKKTLHLHCFFSSFRNSLETKTTKT